MNGQTGVRTETSTRWQPAAKPVRLSEIGFPALDKGGNVPNLFFDPKSSESALPPFLNGDRDDVFQRSAFSVALAFWQGQQAIEGTYVWAWDARPFPVREDIWSDRANWTFGHWLNGRAGVSELGRVLVDICARGGVVAEASEVTGLVDGFALTGVSALRGALAPLMSAYGVEALERDGEIVFRHRGQAPVREVARAELIEGGLQRTRRLLDKPPGALRLTYIGGGEGYQPATVEARAQLVADYMLGQAARGDSAALGLALAHIDIEAGDGVRVAGGNAIWRVSEVMQAGSQALQLEMDAGELARVRSVEPAADAGTLVSLALPEVWVIDGPVLPDPIGDGRPLLAGVGNAWPGLVNVSAGLEAAQFSARAELVEAGGVGRLLGKLARGPLGRWDEASGLHIEVPGEVLASHSVLSALNGASPLLVKNASGWELIGYRDADLTGEDQYRLTGLLRGLQGSQVLEVEAGALCVLLDNRLARGNVRREELGTLGGGLTTIGSGLRPRIEAGLWSSCSATE